MQEVHRYNEDRLFPAKCHPISVAEYETARYSGASVKFHYAAALKRFRFETDARSATCHGQPLWLPLSLLLPKSFLKKNLNYSC